MTQKKTSVVGIEYFLTDSFMSVFKFSLFVKRWLPRRITVITIPTVAKMTIVQLIVGFYDFSPYTTAESAMFVWERNWREIAILKQIIV